MKVLMLSTDKLAFEPNSAVAKRLADYAALVDELQVVVFGRKTWLAVKQGNLTIVGKTLFSAFWWSPPAADIVTTQDPFEVGLIGWWWARRLNKPLQLQIHTDLFNPAFASQSLKNWWRVQIAKWLIPRATNYRVVSEKIKQSFLERFPLIHLDAIVVLPIFVDVERLKSALITIDLHKNYPQFEKIILMASRLTAEKNIEMGIRAFKEVLVSLPKTGLVIVGRGPSESVLRQLVSDLGLSSKVLFLPWADDLASYYKSADLFLSTSLYEGYGLTIVEALAAGCPVVSTDVGVARESGATIADKEDLAGKIIDALQQPRQANLLNYPYESKEQYLKAYIEALRSKS